MLIEFRVENHRSLRDEQVITMEAGPRVGDADDTRPRTVAGHKKKLLPAAVIYGANASGKSNVLSAMAFMREAVVNSFRRWKPDARIPRTSFAWNGKSGDTSLFEVLFVVMGVKYQYGFTVDDVAVVDEWLYAWPGARRQVWFERERDQFKFGGFLKGPKDIVKKAARGNALYLSIATQYNHRLLSRLFTWFDRISIPSRRFTRVSSLFDGANVFPFYTQQPSTSPTGEQDDVSMASRLQLLKTADLGIVDIKNKEIDVQIGEETFSGWQTHLKHQSDDEESWLDLEQESEGTKTLFKLADVVFQAIDSGSLLLIDELESSLHPSLALAIVKMFNCPKSNPKNAQLLFTTHDTNLLGTTLGEPPLRRDQIWFTEKDQEGATTLYPLTDYKRKPRKSENLERGYLQGRYGAIPFLGDMAWIAE